MWQADDEPLAPKAGCAGKNDKVQRSRADRRQGKKGTRRRRRRWKEKAAAAPAPMPQRRRRRSRWQSAPLGLSGDTAAKKKKKRVEGAAKERLQEQAPAPPKAKPEATPIPPRACGVNGEPRGEPAAGGACGDGAQCGRAAQRAG